MVNVSRDTAVYIYFNEAVRMPDNNEFTYSNVDQIVIFKKNDANGESVPFDAVISTDRKMITITPLSQLAHTQTYYVAVTNDYEDYSNNRGAASSASFKTVDLTGPVITINPENNATYVLSNSPVTFLFDEPVRNIDNSELTNSHVNSLIVLKTADENGANVPFTATINSAKTIITVVPDHHLLMHTTYYVAIAAGVEDYNNNLSAPASSTFTTGGSTGLEDNLMNNIKVYPNPGNGIFTIDFINQTRKQIKVTDINGRIIFNDPDVSGESYRLDMRNNNDGIYFLYLTDSDKGTFYTYKLIKQNGTK